MTTRSAASSLFGGRTASRFVPRDDADVYHYALRVAILHYVRQQSPLAQDNVGGESGGSNGRNGTRPTVAAATMSGGTGSSNSHGGFNGSSSRTGVGGRPVSGSTTKDGSTSAAAGWRDALSSLGDVFSSSSSSSTPGKVKFPKEFPRVLEQRMVAISKGTDARHTDGDLRAVVGAFYGTFSAKPFQAKLVQNRKIEEVILHFVTTASGIIRRRMTDQNRGDEWQPVLNAVVAQFVVVIRDALRGIRSTSPELLQRLESYCAKLAGPATGSPATSGNGPSVSATSAARDSSPTPSTSKYTLDQPPPQGGSASMSATLSSVSTHSTNVQEMPLVLAVGRMFGKLEAELTRDVVSLRRLCTEQAAFHDLKTCINLVAQSSQSNAARFPARREDFDSDDAFAAWRKQEADELQELLLGMIQRSPELVNSAPVLGPTSADGSPALGNGSAGGAGSNRSSLPAIQPVPSPDGSFVASSVAEDDGIGTQLVDTSAFVFVPPDPKFYYKRLYEIALDYDYDAMKDLPPDQDVSLTIVSALHEELLTACATCWRVGATVRASTFLALIGQHYKMQGVPEACVAEALKGVERVDENWNYWRWPWADVSV